ncbi:MAG: hypothetical protein K6348_05465 [Deferribacterales bacterium]
MGDKSEEIRIKYKYKELILKNKVKVGINAAKKIVGPDTAYHLYRQLKTDQDKKG